MTKTKSSFFPTIFVVGIVAVAAYILMPSLISDKRKGEGAKLVTVSVVWAPADRNRPGDRPDTTLAVAISMKAGAEVYPLEREYVSPWSVTVYLYRGQVADVRADQLFGIDLSCRIIQLGAPPKSREILGPGFVHCRHTVI